jgi:hypothetical protein
MQPYMILPIAMLFAARSFVDRAPQSGSGMAAQAVEKK